MSRVSANDPNYAFALYDFALLTTNFNRSSYLHRNHPWNRLTMLLKAVSNSSPCQVIGGEFHQDLITTEYPYEMKPHLAGGMRQNLMPIGQLNAKHGIRQRFYHCSFYLNDFLFGHRPSAHPFQAALEHSQCLRHTISNGDGMLKMSGKLAIGCNDRPFIISHLGTPYPGVKHGLQRHSHALFQ